jgi:hypothetical protein
LPDWRPAMPSIHRSHDEEGWLCWSCQKIIYEDTGLSLNDTSEMHVCYECWQDVPVTSRMVLGLLFRNLAKGGFGIGDLVQSSIDKWPFIPGQSRN